jgi:predicted PurR-regulated permease PerM
MATPDPPAAPSDPTSESGFTRTVVFQGALLLGGLVAFFFLLIELSGVMNPLLLAAAATVLVWPMREHPVARSLLLAGGLVLLWWLLMVTGEVLLPFAVVYLLAYLLDPAVGAAHRRWHVPRWASSLALTLVAVGALVAVFVFLVPNVVARVEELVAGLLASLSHAQTWIMESRLVAYLDESNLVARDDLEAQLTSVLPEQIGGLVAQIPVALEALTRSVSAIITLIVTVTLIPVLLFYTLRDFPTIERNLVGLFPKVGGDRHYLRNVGHIVGSYLRGQIAISAISAFNVSLFLTIFGAPFPLLIGLLAGLLNMIPNIGVIITNVIGVGIALIFGTPVDALVVVLVLFGQQILEATILSPNIMSHQVGLHPVLVILSLLLFGATMGFFGLLIAVPLTALLVTFYTSYREEMTLDLSDYASGGSGLIVGPEAEVEVETEEKAAP